MSRRVIIIGASIAGMLAAKAMSDFFDEVWLLERDVLSDQPETRSGTAQAHHAHILLNRGLLEMEQIFPGLRQQLLAAGAIVTHATQDWYSLFPMGPLPNFDSDLTFLCASRPLIEQSMRTALLAACTNVRIHQHTKVLEVVLHVNNAPRVRVQTSPTTIDEWHADFVIDASGRNSHSPTWLRQAGFSEVEQIHIRPYLGYATRIYRGVTMPSPLRAAVVMAKDPDMKRGGVLFPIEGNRYICTLYGFNQDYPGIVDADFMKFAKSLRSDIIYQAIHQAIPESNAKAFIKKDSRYYLYAKQGDWPQGYLVIGDAVCSFNPIYGQGMTAAAMAAANLVQQLKKSHPLRAGFSRNTQRHIVRAYRAPWHISTNEDLRWPGTDGNGKSRGIGLRTLHKFSDRIAAAATRDHQLAYRYIKVLHMTATPLSLLSLKSLMSILKSMYVKSPQCLVEKTTEKIR